MYGNESEEYYLHTYEIELKERAITKLTWKEKLTIYEASFLIPSILFISLKFFLMILFIYLVGQDGFNCIVVGRNSIIICQENNRRLEVESSLLEVMINK